MTQLTPIPADVAAPSKPGIRAATQLLRAFAARGVGAAFVIPGGAVGPIFDALADVPEIDLVSTRHEATAVFAAIGHARATGKPALVLVTSGPGATNTLTGVACAEAEDVPVILIGGDVATRFAGRGAFQDGSHLGLDVVGLMRNITRFSTSVFSPSMAAGAAARAWSAATTGRPGPVFLAVPYDVGLTTSSESEIAHSPSHVQEPDPAACRAAKDLLVSAKRPLLVLGSGARGAVRASVALAEQLSAPVVVTSHAKGVFPERHPLYLGLLGNAEHPSARDYVVSRPDVVCVVGSRLGDFATNGWRLPIAGKTATIQIDRDPLRIGCNAPVTLGIVADSALALDAIHQAPSQSRPAPIRECVGFRTLPWERSSSPGLLKPQRVVEAIGEAFSDAVFCSDIGEHMGFAQHYLLVEGPDRFHCMAGLGSMGSGLGAAIGVQHARPCERVVAFVGDGGFHMHAGELLTCVERDIGVIFVVFNDGCWNMVEHGFRAIFRRAPCRLPRQIADIAAIARSYGADACRLDDEAALEPSRLRALARPGVPLVLDVRIDPRESLSRANRSQALRASRPGDPRGAE